MNTENLYSEKAIEMAKLLLDKGVFDIDIVDVSKKTKMAKNLVIGTANSSESAKEIALDFCEEIDKKGIELYSCDGFNKGEWIVLDYDEVIIHIFTKSTREKYNLEKLWR